MRAGVRAHSHGRVQVTHPGNDSDPLKNKPESCASTWSGVRAGRRRQTSFLGFEGKKHIDRTINTRSADGTRQALCPPTAALSTPFCRQMKLSSLETKYSRPKNGQDDELRRRKHDRERRAADARTGTEGGGRVQAEQHDAMHCRSLRLFPTRAERAVEVRVTNAETRLVDTRYTRQRNTKESDHPPSRMREKPHHTQHRSTARIQPKKSWANVIAHAVISWQGRVTKKKGGRTKDRRGRVALLIEYKIQTMCA